MQVIKNYHYFLNIFNTSTNRTHINEIITTQIKTITNIIEYFTQDHPQYHSSYK